MCNNFYYLLNYASPVKHCCFVCVISHGFLSIFRLFGTNFVSPLMADKLHVLFIYTQCLQYIFVKAYHLLNSLKPNITWLKIKMTATRNSVQIYRSDTPGGGIEYGHYIFL